jgi:hypothetical protein
VICLWIVSLARRAADQVFDPRDKDILRYEQLARFIEAELPSNEQLGKSL